MAISSSPSSNSYGSSFAGKSAPKADKAAQPQFGGFGFQDTAKFLFSKEIGDASNPLNKWEKTGTTLFSSAFFSFTGLSTIGIFKGIKSAFTGIAGLFKRAPQVEQNSYRR